MPEENTDMNALMRRAAGLIEDDASESEDEEGEERETPDMNTRIRNLFRGET
jgi:hypothetical protein